MSLITLPPLGRCPLTVPLQSTPPSPSSPGPHVIITCSQEGQLKTVISPQVCEHHQDKEIQGSPQSSAFLFPCRVPGLESLHSPSGHFFRLSGPVNHVLRWGGTDSPPHSQVQAFKEPRTTGLFLSTVPTLLQFSCQKNNKIPTGYTRSGRLEKYISR